MTTEETAVTLSDLTFEEAEQLEDVLDMAIDEIANRLNGTKPKVRIIRALKWIELRRGDPDAAFSDTAGFSIVDAFDTPDPKAPGGERGAKPKTTSTRRSASSTAT